MPELEAPSKRCKTSSLPDDMPDLVEDEPESDKMARTLLESIVKQEPAPPPPSGPNDGEQSDEAINFEDFIAEAPVDSEQVASVLDQLLNEPDENADLILLPERITFSETLHPLGIKEELTEKGYNDVNDRCNGCDKESCDVKTMCQCEEKGCSLGGWWCTDCQPSFDDEQKRFEKSFKKALNYKCKTSNGIDLCNQYKNLLIEQNPWACDSCANTESYVKKNDMWTRHWKRKVELARKKVKDLDKKTKEDKEKKLAKNKRERRIQCPECELTLYMGPWKAVFGKVGEKKHKRDLQKILKMLKQSPVDDDKLMATIVMETHLELVMWVFALFCQI